MKLIVNADDFGLTIGVSRGILDGMKNGIITDTSAIVNTCAFIKSAEMALNQGVHSMGIHLLLTMGDPLTPKDKVKSLLSEDGHFCKRAKLSSMKFDMKQVQIELEAQISRFLSTGLSLNHIDTHHGFMNISKEMANLFVELSQKYNVPLRNEASRIPIEKQVFDSTCNVFKTDMIYFNQGRPHHDVDSILTFLETARIKYKCIEIGCHPGYSDQLLRSISALHDDREIDLSVCLDVRVSNYIQTHEITLHSYSTI